MKFLCGTLIVLIPLPSVADNISDYSWYAGVGAGGSHYSGDETLEPDSVSYLLFGGYKINQYLGVQLNYSQLGKYESDNSVLNHTNIDVLGVTAQGNLPLYDTGIEFSLGLGLQYINYEQSYMIEGNKINAKSSTVSPLFTSLGINYTFEKAPQLTYSLTVHGYLFQVEQVVSGQIATSNNFGEIGDHLITSVNLSAQNNF